MTRRPTPEQIIVRAIEKGGVGNAHHAWVLAELQRHDYVLVHPDDVPLARDAYPAPKHSREEIGRVIGWDDCRRHIFGVDQ